MDLEKARFNMIEQQIRPWDVLDQEILDLLAVVKREQFVPQAYAALAFVDMEIPLPAARTCCPRASRPAPAGPERAQA
jgi:protein-L-isoaspartate(D-aspartate) O-methyltransferase